MILNHSKKNVKHTSDARLPRSLGRRWENVIDIDEDVIVIEAANGRKITTVFEVTRKYQCHTNTVPQKYTAYYFKYGPRVTFNNESRNKTEDWKIKRVIIE